MAYLVACPEASLFLASPGAEYRHHWANLGSFTLDSFFVRRWSRRAARSSRIPAPSSPARVDNPPGTAGTWRPSASRDPSRGRSPARQSGCPAIYHGPPPRPASHGPPVEPRRSTARKGSAALRPRAEQGDALLPDHAAHGGGMHADLLRHGSRRQRDRPLGLSVEIAALRLHCRLADALEDLSALAPRSRLARGSVPAKSAAEAVSRSGNSRTGARSPDPSGGASRSRPGGRRGSWRTRGPGPAGSTPAASAWCP
jgi:hypothetical protein